MKANEEMSISKRTHGNYQKYTNPNPVQQVLIRHFLHAVHDILVRVAPRRVLDVGCAEGFVSGHALSSLPHTHVIGVDVDTYALQRAGHLHPKMQRVVGDALHLPLADKSADLVLCTEVLEHIPAPEQALAELTRVARTYLLLSVPWEPWFRVANLLRLKNISRLGDDPEHVNHWTGRAFRRFVREFGHVEVHRVAFPWQIALIRLTAETRSFHILDQKGVSP